MVSATISDAITAMKSLDQDAYEVLTNSLKAFCSFLGIIDWGEVKKSPLVFELATMMALLMCEAQTSGFNVDNGARSIIRGFTDKIHLTEAEKDCLFYCVTARLATYICAVGFVLASHELDQAHKQTITRLYLPAASILKHLNTQGCKAMLLHWLYYDTDKAKAFFP